jgi:hypothetical protein
MEHNQIGYAKNYSCRSTKISKGSDLIRKIDYSIRDFSKY